MAKQLIHNISRDFHDKIIKCEVHNAVGKSEESKTLDISCKYPNQNTRSSGDFSFPHSLSHSVTVSQSVSRWVSQSFVPSEGKCNAVARLVKF